MTLIEDIARRQKELEQRNEARKKDRESREDLDVLDFMLVPTMWLVNLTLAVVVRTQYGQELTLPLVLRDSWTSLLLFPFLICIVHPRRNTTWIQVGAFAACGAVGCWLVSIASNAGYYAVMEKAPRLGTIWVWLFIELKWPMAILNLAFVGIYSTYFGYLL